MHRQPNARKGLHQYAVRTFGSRAQVTVHRDDGHLHGGACALVSD
jgi:hypothetical protein